MGREFELKFRADPEKIQEIQEKYGAFSTISMETSYYDTKDQLLARHHRTLRRRMENGISVCTYKCPHPDGGRRELEVEAPSILEGVQKLCLAGADPLLLRCASRELVETCGARFTRLAATLQIPGGQVELALDQGFLLGGGKELPLAEVEVELKEGPDEIALTFARALEQEFGLVPEKKSKFARARELAML